MAWTHQEPQTAKADGTISPPNVDAEASRRKQTAAVETQVLDVAPKVVDSCSVIRSHLGHTVRQTVTDVVHYFINPMSAVGSAARRADRHRKKKIADRVTEFRLCVDMVEDCLDAYTHSHFRDELSTEEETLTALSDLLMRITELTFMHRAAVASSRDTEAAELLQVLREPDFDPADFTHHLMDSGLGISGLLEACLGELTDWQVSPEQEERVKWVYWDRIHKHLHHQVIQAELETDESWKEPLVLEVCCDHPNLKCGQAVGDKPIADKLPARHFCGTLSLPKICAPEKSSRMDRSTEDALVQLSTRSNRPGLVESR